MQKILTLVVALMLLPAFSGCLEAEDVMKSMLKEAKEEAFTGGQAEISQLEEMVDIHYIEK